MSRHCVYRFDEFLVDPEAWGLYRDGREVHVEPVVFKLLTFLIEHRGRLVTRSELIDSVWGDTVVSDSALASAINRLREALGDKPAQHRYLETVHGKGYRFVADVEEIETGETYDGRDPSPPEPRRWRGLYTVIAAGLLLLLAYLFWPVKPHSEIRSLAVLPLDNLTGDPQQDQYVASLHEFLIMELYRAGGLSVTSRQSTMRFVGSDLPLPQIARELGVDALVEGSAIHVSDRVEITLQLIHGSTDEHLWAESYERDERYVPSLFAYAASDILAAMGKEPRARRAVKPIDPLANRAYLAGLTHLSRTTPDGLKRAIDKFNEAVSIEPAYAEAWGNLGAAHMWESVAGFTPLETALEHGRAACEKTLEADEDFYLGHVCIGWAHWFARDVEKACQSFEFALRLNPSDPYSLHGNADCMLLDGRIDENLELTRRMQMVDPFSSASNRHYSFHLAFSGRYDEAIAESIRQQERFPEYSMHEFRAMVYWAQGLREEAIDEERLEFEHRKDEVLLTALKEGLTVGGPVGAWRAISEAMVVRVESRYVDPFDIANAFTRARMLDEAFYWYEKAVDRGSARVAYLPVWPDLEALRDDPRYLRLMQTAGLSEFAQRWLHKSISDHSLFYSQSVSEVGPQRVLGSQMGRKLLSPMEIQPVPLSSASQGSD